MIAIVSVVLLFIARTPGASLSLSLPQSHRIRVIRKVTGVDKG
jgi:hypothetical protein